MRRARPRPGAQRHHSKIVIGVGLILVVVLLVNSLASSSPVLITFAGLTHLSLVLQANTGFPSSRKSARAAERQLADRVLEVQDYGGTQEVAIQQGDTTTVIQQDPSSSRPKVEVHDKQGVHTASKYKPLDTPGISVTKGGAHNQNTVVQVGEGDTKQSIELLKNPTSAAGNISAAGAVADKLSLATGAAAAAANSTEGKTKSTKAAASGSTAAKGSKATSATSGKKKKSSFHGGGTALDSAASSNNTERASQDQKQAMAATDRQKSSSSGEVSSSSSSEAHPKDPARRQADTGLSGPLSSVGMAAAAVASGVKSFVTNSSEVYMLQSLAWRAVPAGLIMVQRCLALHQGTQLSSSLEVHPVNCKSMH